uniref:uncharacterized protein YER152C-like isoform X1 n=1 Tax=Styela clava TaxID=7725 RepID=UPI00193AAF0E|nr:uncharacterized protein YER152C-like isoform X1 [Styela clava]
MPKFYTEFDEGLGIDVRDRVCLQIGSPGPHCLREVAKIMKEATVEHFSDSNPRNEEILQYGCCGGNYDLKEELVKFLSSNYRNPVEIEDIFMHNGVSQGLANILYHYFQRGETLFVEDPTYWNLLTDFNTGNSSFKMNAVGVGLDENGIKLTELEEHLKKLEAPEISERYPYKAALYIIPVHQNPSGTILSQDRCAKLIKLARKYDLLVITDDVYSVMTYSAPDSDDPTKAKPPNRLFWHDKKSDPDYKGNVVSASSFSKLVAPGLRLGWFEMSKKMYQTFATFFVTDSGSGWNPYTSGILAQAFKLGLIQEHVKKIRREYWRLFNRVHDLVNDRLKRYGVYCNLPKGGLFMWITLPQGFSTTKLLENCVEELTFIPGKRCSVSGNHDNCLRLAVAFYEEGVLFPAVSKLCDYIEKLVTTKD